MHVSVVEIKESLYLKISVSFAMLGSINHFLLDTQLLSA